MTAQECYQKLGGDYHEMLGRVMRDALVVRFALKFLKDDSFSNLSAALEAENTEEAFRAAHTLKGVCANLSFTKLRQSASEMTEFLRGGDLASAKGYFGALAAQYQETVEILQELQDSQ